MVRLVIMRYIGIQFQSGGQNKMKIRILILLFIFLLIGLSIPVSAQDSYSNIIYFHTPDGIIKLNVDTASDYTLSKYGLDRDKLYEVLPIDYEAKIRELEARIEALEGMVK